MINMKFEMEEIPLREGEDGFKVLDLPELTSEEERLIDPIVPPTSGLRIQIYDKKEGASDDHYILTNRKFFLFLRVFKAISQKYREMNNNKNLKVLIVTDDRPSADPLLNYCSDIFNYDGFQVYHQKDKEGKSRMSAPYGAASVALYEDIGLILVLTASHNELSWNGIKFYIEYPIPMSGDLFKEISQIALDVDQIKLKSTNPTKIDAEKKNNDYVLNLLSKVLELKSIKNENIIIWPYLGKARGIVNLFRRLGANVTLIEETVNPPNPIKTIKEEKLQRIMDEVNSNLVLLLDADRDRITLYIKQNGEYFTYIPNEIYSAMHNILARDFDKKILNVRTIPSDLRGDETSFLNILTGVGYKHLGIILYFLFGVEVDQSKVDSGILYMEGKEGDLIQIKEPAPLKKKIISLMKQKELKEARFVVVMWEESGGHTINILNVSKNGEDSDYSFTTNLPLIADKYPVPALVLITELISRGYVINEAIDWSIKGINRTIDASDNEKVKLMENFEENDSKEIEIKDKVYRVKALSDNLGNTEIYQLKSKDSTLYFRPSGTGPDVRFYIFGDRESYLEEIKRVQDYVRKNYMICK
jgi:phosphomannomutase